ncbi:MAG: DUF2993 domain-containing protein [Acaryochloris sp. SU_5_25]|nr:DUF2993 domain-containing protein [Acaryochloris sp. SU_5_25]
MLPSAIGSSRAKSTVDYQGDLGQQRKNRLIARVLTPAIKVWLRSQLDSIDNLQLDIDSSNREILSGAIPKVFLAASQAVYKGIHLSQAQVIAENIRTNLGQVLRGKALQLLEPLPIDLEATLTATDLRASAAAPLFQQALQMGLVPLLAQQLNVFSDWPFPCWQPLANPLAVSQITVSALRMELRPQRLHIHAQVAHPSVPQPQWVMLNTGLKLVNPHELQLDEPQGCFPATHQSMSLAQLQNFSFDLGPDVCLDQLQITAEAILCQGQIKIMPVQAEDSDLD